MPTDCVSGLSSTMGGASGAIDTLHQRCAGGGQVSNAGHVGRGQGLHGGMGISGEAYLQSTLETADSFARLA